MHDERSEEEKQAQRDAWDGIDRRRHGAAFDLLRKEFDQRQLRPVITEVREESHPVVFRSAYWIIMVLIFLWLMAVGAVIYAMVRLVLEITSFSPF